MHPSSSPHDEPVPTSASSRATTEARAVRLDEPGLVILALVRIFFGVLWLQQLGWKMPPTYGGLRGFVEREVEGTIIPGYSFIVEHVFLANFPLLGAGIWITELLVSITLLMGLFTRLGALLALILSLQLYVGLAYAPGEWYWTYGMMVLLSVVLLAMPAGRRLSLDQLLAPRFQSLAANNRLVRVLGWFVS